MDNKLKYGLFLTSVIAGGIIIFSFTAKGKEFFGRNKIIATKNIPITDEIKPIVDEIEISVGKKNRGTNAFGGCASQ